MQQLEIISHLLAVTIVRLVWLLSFPEKGILYHENAAESNVAFCGFAYTHVASHTRDFPATRTSVSFAVI